MQQINASDTMSVQQLLDKGLHCYHNGKLEDALFYFEQLLTIASDNVELLHTIVKLLQEMEDFDKASFYGEKLLVLSPESEDFLLSQAENYFYINSYDKALPLYLRLHKLHPSSIHLLERLTAIYKQQYVFFETEIESPDEKKNDSQHSIINKALSFSELMINRNQLDEARLLLESVLLIEGDNVEANGLYGVLLKETQEYDKALYYLDKIVIKSSFKYLTAFTQCLEKSIGVLSVVHYLESLVKKFPEDYLNKKLLGLYYYKNGDYVKADDILSALSIVDEEDILLIKYRVLSRYKLIDGSKTFIEKDKLISVSNEMFSLRKTFPHDLEVATNLIKLYINMGEIEKSYDICRKLDQEIPNNKTIIWNMYLYFLAIRDRESYFRSYLAGRSIRCKSSWESLESKVWNGESIKEKRVVILREQGIGDEILFASNYGWVIEQASHVDIYCSSRLSNSFSRIFPTAHFHPFVEDKGLNNVPGFLECISSADTVILSGDLPAFHHKSTGLPLYDEQYFTVKDEKSLFWKRELDKLISTNKPKAGLIWRSGFISGSRSTAYLTNSEVAVIIAAIPEVEFVNCMYVECEEELNEIETLTDRKIHRLDELDQKNDFENTAAMLSNLDLLFGAYTATLSLSAAVGTPTVAYSGDYLKEDKKLKKDAFYYSNVSHISLPLNDSSKRKEAINLIIDEIRTILQLDSDSISKI